MAIEESLLQDAPNTPGHVFAYRAFRSIFVGSPNSSPVKPNDNHDKENIPITTRSPVKRGHDEVASISKTTPKRQRTNPVSPAKSILRNPAEPTPRSAMIRDINVTFKDLRKSASPELRKRPVPEKQNKLPEHDLLSASNEKTIPSMKTSELQTQANPMLEPREAQNLPAAPAITSTSTTSSFDLEEYMRNTENEMKKLLKYGQKMRDYARKQDEENAKLRKLLQEVRQENDRLRQAAAFGKDDARVLDAGTDMQRMGKLDGAGATHSKMMEKRLQPTDIIPSIENTTFKNPVQRRYDTNTVITTAGSQKVKHSLPRKIVNDIEKKTKTAQPTDSAARHKDPPSLRKDMPTSNLALSAVFEVPIRDLRDQHKSTSVSIPADRAAAARERLRRKNGLRRASANVHQSSAVVEDSQVDWAGL